MSPTPVQLREFVRTHAAGFLADPNITSIGIGYKVVGGRRTETVSVQFTVSEKLHLESIVDYPTAPIPPTVTVAGEHVPTDVLERDYRPAYAIVPEGASDARTERIDPVVPGVSIAGERESAGTLGCIVWDRETGRPHVLSNWHVLQGPLGAIGEDVLQPGPHDDNRVGRNRLGTLVRSHLGVAGDCAIASIEDRGFDPEILDLGVAPESLGEPELDDLVIKSSRTTAVTRGRVTRVDVVVKLDYGTAGTHRIGGFEISPDGRGRAQLSDGGDSGAVWMFRAANGKPSKVMAGLHFAGEDPGHKTPEHALACLPRSVFTKLGITLTPGTNGKPGKPGEPGEPQHPGAPGYDEAFLSTPVPLPTLAPEQAADAVDLDGSPAIPYTHFSLVMSRSRRLARFVAWNVDGASIKKLPRTNRFQLDPRLPAQVQVGDELYAGNRLDRGHIARRADLTWGPTAEARQANLDSFFFTNICPQMDSFNQAAKLGLWGRLEDVLYEQVAVERLRISVIGGPVLREDDRSYRGIQVPREFWKVIAFVEDGTLKARAFLLTQDLDPLESLDLGEFTTYQVELADLTARTGVVFPPALLPGPRAERVAAREIRREDDIVW